MAQTLSLPVLPLDDAVVLPSMVVPLDISAPEARAAIEAAQLAAKAASPSDGETQAQVLLVPRPDGSYAPVGTLASIEQVGRLPSGERAAVVRGLARIRIGTGTVGPGSALWVEGTLIEEPEATAKTAELAREYRGLAATILQKRGAWQYVDVLQRITDPAQLSDSAGYAGYLSLEQQRELLLRQQLAAIRKELAELDGKPASEEEDYRARIEAADLPEKVREAALKEAAKLERGSDASPEAGWIRTWLDTVLEIPWNTRTGDAYDIG